MLSLFSKITKDKRLKEYREIAELVDTFEDKMKSLSDEKMREMTKEFKSRLKSGESEDQILPEAFALVREASVRMLGLRHFPAQIIGGAALHNGNITEMRTGEGKTLASTLPVYVNALLEKGVHVITVNDYLAKRDTVWMGQIYHSLGLGVTCLVHEGAYLYDPSFEGEKRADEERDIVGGFKIVDKFLKPISRKEAYEADITYGTNHEFGFDYLRDNLAMSENMKVQRGHPYAIIDEVDSILIDEARTPLIISAPDAQSSEYYKTFARIVERLQPEEDYIVDEKLKSSSITEPGIEKIEKLMGIKNLFDPENSRLVHFMQESLRAKALFHKDKNYVVKNDEVLIVDEFTGRILEGRRYSGGLHQAIEAKEGVFVKEENRTYAQITIQNYFRMYEKISGMTGTAETSAEEFHKVYNLEVVVIPTNKPMIREDLTDRIYRNSEAKYNALVRDIEERHKKGQPILIGTASISHNENFSNYLHKAGIRHEILNAKNNESEGSVIAQAGKFGAVTLATNMAGRGVDIVLGGNPQNKDEAQKIIEVGGLHVIGTERHEARRIDNQLRGRAGRQGDPGSSQFFLSVEDEIVRIFGGERISGLMKAVNYPEDVPIESKMVSKAVNQAQQKVEGMNFDIRKHLLDFDDVLNKQRLAVYTRRDNFMKESGKDSIVEIIREVLFRHIELVRFEADNFEGSEVHEESEKRLKIIEEFENKTKDLPSKIEEERSKMIAGHLIRVSDTLWVEHLENLEALREFVNIRAYGQHDPIVEYRREGHLLYAQMNKNFDAFVFQTIYPLFEMDLSKQSVVVGEEKKIAPPPGSKNIGRNDPCWCGVKYEDGRPKKYKHCHGR